VIGIAGNAVEDVVERKFGVFRSATLEPDDELLLP